MRRFFRKIHLWISVPIGLIISITCFTGAILVFEKEILALAHPHLYRCEVPEGSAMMSGEEIAKTLNALGTDISVAHGKQAEAAGPAEVAKVRLPDRRLFIAPGTYCFGTTAMKSRSASESLTRLWV